MSEVTAPLRAQGIGLLNEEHHVLCVKISPYLTFNFEHCSLYNESLKSDIILRRFNVKVHQRYPYFLQVPSLLTYPWKIQLHLMAKTAA